MPRISLATAAPGAYQAMLAMTKYVAASGLELSLLELVKVRASQMNRCAWCLDMHWKDARAAGETEQRLYGLDAWHEAPYYTPRERAALAWTETLTFVAEKGAPPELFDAVKAQFTDAEIVNLTMAIVNINAWNRLMIGFGVEAGGYTPQRG